MLQKGFWNVYRLIFVDRDSIRNLKAVIGVRLNFFCWAGDEDNRGRMDDVTSDYDI